MREASERKKYITDIVFVREMIAPCGMNCGSCLGYMRTTNHCPGCRTDCDTKPPFCRECIVINCSHLRTTESKFCFDCPGFPCRRLKNLDKRYRTRYNTSFFDNLAMIKEKGIDEFLEFETVRRTCPKCGSILCIHRKSCLQCGSANPLLPGSFTGQTLDK